MSFVSPEDEGYKRAKRARQGHLHVDDRLVGFTRWFQETYRVAPLWLELDHIERARTRLPWPRLSVVLERSDQYTSFLSGAFNFDIKKQRAIAAALVDHVEPAELRRMFCLPRRRFGGNLAAADVFVCFDDFERVVKQEAHLAVSEAEVARYAAGLGLGSALWCTQRLWGPPILFVHTAAEATELKASPDRREWADAYFELVRRHDEFGYMTPEEIAIMVDSKENFDENYSSNWYYYFK
ncbi:MAG: hypothetical protein M3P04_14750 [Actinomycetota bacterium]|nr:hypothetical protein [Actinomycetota bacterium]